MAYLSDPNAVPTSQPSTDTARKIAQALYARTAGGNRQTINLGNYMARLPYNYEGLLRVYEQQKGPQAAQQLMQALPQMTLPQLRALEQELATAGQRDDYQRDLLIKGLGGPR